MQTYLLNIWGDNRNNPNRSQKSIFNRQVTNGLHVMLGSSSGLLAVRSRGFPSFKTPTIAHRQQGPSYRTAKASKEHQALLGKSH